MPRPLPHRTSSRPPEDAGAIRTIEVLRDTQSEIRRGLETAGASTTQRLAAIEERLLALETRQHPPQ